MQKILFLFALLAGITLSSCSNSDNSKIETEVVNNAKSADGERKPYETPRITFKNTEHDFGNIISGEFVRYSYRFTNTGKSDLLISKVKASCGCTVPSYPKKAIKPGESDLIEVIFDSRGRKGIQNKTVTVMSNAVPNRTTLRFKANCVAPENN